MGFKLIESTAANDSDIVVMTVPTGVTYEILYGHITFTTTATVGNRQLKFECRDDSDNLVWDEHAGTTQAASLAYEYSLSQGVYRETAVIDASLDVPIASDLILLPGWDLRVYDADAIDAAADDLIIRIMVKETSIR